MAAADMPLAREEGDSIVAAWDPVEFMIPEAYFSDPPLAEDLGGSVDLLCFVDVRAYEKEGSKPRTFGIRLPAKVRVRYTEATIETDGDGDKVRVFASRAGDILIDDVNVVQSSDNVSGLFRVLAAARITGVSYVDLASLFIDGAKLNGAGTGVTRSVLEAAISEMARWNKDTSVPLRIPLAAGRATLRAVNDEAPPPADVLGKCVADLRRAIELHGNCGGKKDLERAERLLKKHAATGG